MVDPKKAGEQADAIIASLNLAKQGVAAPAENVDQGAGSVAESTESLPDVGVPAASSVAVTDPAVEQLRKEAAVADQRWRSLQGIVNKQNTEMEQLRVLLAQSHQKQEPKQPDAQAPLKDVTKQDVEEFGQDLIDLITKIATGVTMNAMPQFNARLDNMQKSLTTVADTTARTAEEKFFDDLTKRVSDWESINVDTDFIQSLQEVDELSGARKIDLLTDAYNRMDVPRTARFFEIFKGTVAAPVVAEKKELPPVPDVTKLVSPGKSKATPAAPAAESKMWSKADITALYAANRNGSISAEEFAAQERDLFKAQRENRLAA